MSDPLVSVSEFSEWVGLPEPADLARAQAHLATASAMIRRFTSQTLSTVTGDVVVLPPVDRDTLLLPERPVTAVSYVLVDNVPVTAFWFQRSGLLHSGTMVLPGPWWSLGATVTYDHGYAEASDDFAAIKAVCLAVAARSYSMDETSAEVSLRADRAGTTFMESAGFAPEAFLTHAEKQILGDFGKVGVG